MDNKKILVWPEHFCVDMGDTEEQAHRAYKYLFEKMKELEYFESVDDNVKYYEDEIKKAQDYIDYWMENKIPESISKEITDELKRKEETIKERKKYILKETMEKVNYKRACDGNIYSIISFLTGIRYNSEDVNWMMMELIIPTE